MSSTVFILGAGASQKAGAPLMGNFLDVARELWKTEGAGNAIKSFETVFNGINSLQGALSKSHLDIHNIESVFAAFEMAKTLQRFGNYSLDEIAELTVSIRKLITRTIERTMPFFIGNDEIIPPSPYKEFAELIGFLQGQANPRQTVSIITFNYDLAVDYSLHNGGISYSYGLEEAQSSGTLKLLKLHGSLNWGNCPNCKSVSAIRIDQVFPGNLPQRVDRIFPDIESTLATRCHKCSQSLDDEPVLVPPTWDKGEYHRQIGSVWRAAAQELAGAENIFVIGYSLPRSDLFFHYLYALGTMSEPTILRFWVFDPQDPEENVDSVKSRFRDLFGGGAQQRFDYKRVVFSQALPIIRKEFTKEKLGQAKVNRRSYNQ